jgi:FtsZ-interacting cell division protein ZipA
MDASTFRWVLIIIALLLVLAIFFYGKHQSRLRKRSAIDTYTREEIDSAFIEDEQLRTELDNLNQILKENEVEEDLDDIKINPVYDVQTTPFSLPDPQIHVHQTIARLKPERLINYHLRHTDFRLITGEEAASAIEQTALELNADGLLESRDGETIAFQVASLTAPGDFTGVKDLEFSTLGFNCFIDLDACENPGLAYETLLKKIDELVRLLNVKVYKSDQELLTISDVTEIRKNLQSAG